AALNEEIASLELDRTLTAQRQERILSRVEEAVVLGLEPMEDMLRVTGQDVDALLASLRASYSGAGGPLTALAPGSALLEEDPRLETLFGGLERLGLLNMAAEKLPFGTPYAGAVRLTSSFGPRRDPINRRIRQHNGVDYAGPHGTDILAAADGVVTFAGRQRGYGIVIKIEHAWGFETVYAHLSRMRVSVGERVVRGEHIGDMGNTGRSTGTHLHYEIRRDGIPTNPTTFLRAARDVL
ncbi:MAG: peptidoglycan DD-metalloendopeptidase family protein, partial [Pseudomonadota bacterium]